MAPTRPGWRSNFTGWPLLAWFVKRSRIQSVRIVLVTATAVVLVGCQHTPQPATQLTPAQCVEVGTVTPHGVWNTKKALGRAGIPAYTDGSQYPSPYRILVPPEYRERAVAVLQEIKQRPSSLGYGITHL